MDWSTTSRYASYGAPLTGGGIRMAAAFAAILAREAELPPPAEAAFKEALPEGVSSDEATYHAQALLEEIAAGFSKDEILDRHREISPTLFQAAVSYGARLAARYSPAPVSESPGQMFLRDMLTQDDRRLVEELYVYREVFHRATPERIFAKWRAFVVEVEDGYEDIYDEYVRALDLRDHLEDTVVTMVSPASQERLSAVVRPWDLRFEAATRPIGHSIFPLQWTPRRWWWHRVPQRPGAALTRHLQGVGILRDLRVSN